MLLIAASLFAGACQPGPSPHPPGSGEPSAPEPDAAATAPDGAGRAPDSRAAGDDTAENGSSTPGGDSPDGGGTELLRDGSAREVARDSGATEAAIPSRGPYLIEGLDGEVTARELDAFITAVSAASIPVAQWVQSDPASHNVLCTFGRGGATLEAINLLYEVARSARMTSQQRRLLDLSIAWSDQWLIHRNDLPLGEHRVMWTGKVEPIWPPNHPADPEAAYAASETADTVGILAHTSLNIVSTSELANTIVSDQDPNHLGATYLARAKKYVTMLEVAMDQFFVPSFLDKQSMTIRHPSAPAYAIPGTPGGSQNVNAWNRMMFFANAFQGLGQVHHLLGDDAARDAMYRTVVENIVGSFVKSAVPRAAPDGTPVYDWGYGNFGDIINHLSNEDLSHGQIDIIGLSRAQRAGYAHASAGQLETYASTVLHEIRIGPGIYAGSVNRSRAKTMATTLAGGWLTLSPYVPGLFEAVAGDAMANGRPNRNANDAAYLLWAKHWKAVGGLAPP
jgi:hypothetical protein